MWEGVVTHRVEGVVFFLGYWCANGEEWGSDTADVVLDAGRQGVNRRQ